MNMRMMVQVLAPGMDGQQPDLGAKMLGVRCNGAQRLGRGLE